MAHRGTKPVISEFLKQDGSITTDIEGIIHGKIVPQQNYAYYATSKAIKEARTKKF